MNKAGRDRNLTRAHLSLAIWGILHGTHRKAWWLPSKSPNPRSGLRDPSAAGDIPNLQEKVLFFFYFYCFHFLFLFGVESRRGGRESKEGDKGGKRRSKRGTPQVFPLWADVQARARSALGTTVSPERARSPAVSNPHRELDRCEFHVRLDKVVLREQPLILIANICGVLMACQDDAKLI